MFSKKSDDFRYSIVLKLSNSLIVLIFINFFLNYTSYSLNQTYVLKLSVLIRINLPQKFFIKIVVGLCNIFLWYVLYFEI